MELKHFLEARVHLTRTDTQSQKNTRTRGSKREKTAERSNDYAPDLLTLYFIITAEGKKNTPLLICPAASLSLPLSFTHF